MLMILQGETFKETQRHFIRVKNAYEQKENVVKAYFEEKKLTYDGLHLLLRAFKKKKTWKYG
jgi:hypothetical protein